MPVVKKTKKTHKNQGFFGFFQKNHGFWFFSKKPWFLPTLVQCKHPATLIICLPHPNKAKGKGVQWVPLLGAWPWILRIMERPFAELVVP